LRHFSPGAGSVKTGAHRSNHISPGFAGGAIGKSGSRFCFRSRLDHQGAHDLVAKPLIPWRIARLDRFQNRARANTLVSGNGPWSYRMPGNRNILYLIIGALIVAVGVLGYNLYQTKKEPEGLQINVGPSGVKIQNK
jgi:hypothetical protein